MKVWMKVYHDDDCDYGDSDDGDDWCDNAEVKMT